MALPFGEGRQSHGVRRRPFGGRGWPSSRILGPSSLSPIPPLGYVFLRAKNADDSYSNLSGLKADASRVTLAGKTA